MRKALLAAALTLGLRSGSSLLALLVLPLYAPVLIFGAGHDRIVLTEATRAFAARLPHGKYVELEDAEHEMLMEHDAIRTRFWKEFDMFVSGL